MSETYITCSRCGEPIPDKTVRYMWEHDDFAEHGDHYASWESTPTNFALAREISARLRT